MAGGSRTRRLFFALWPDDAMRAALGTATRKAVRGSGGRPIPIENLHATIAFLGAVAEDRLPGALEAAEGLQAAPFELTMDRIDHWAKSAVLCLACSQSPPAAADLANGLRSRLTRSGFTPDLKPFRPHVTLARKVIKPPALGAIRPVRWPVGELALVESDTRQEGSHYTVLRRWAL